MPSTTHQRMIEDFPRLRPLVDDRWVLSVIAFNALLQFLLAFPAIRAGAHGPLVVLDLLCLAYFGCEQAAKIRILGWRGFWAKGINRFDFVLVALSVPGALLPQVAAEDASLLLVLRACRLLRFVRLLRFIPDSEHLMLGIRRALKASVGLLLALVLYNLLLSLAAVHLFGHLAPEHFGDPLRAMYALFKVFTVEGWFEIPDQVAAEAGPWSAFGIRLFFVGAVLSGGLLGVTLATAVFVDEMVMDNNDDLERQVAALHAELREIKQILLERRGEG